ncbi:MAG: acyl-CoA dehydrogenase family protein [Deltaproteobacteria bacterium]|nr:acyl-CoA dehydrogenase family protein [Deltaproteobacteria bacterium]
MGNFYKDNDDLRFYVDRYIDWAPIVEVTELGKAGAHQGERLRETVETYRDMLDMLGTFAADEMAPAGVQIDRAGGHTLQGGEVRSPKAFDALFAEIKALELHRMCLPTELGGMNCPLLLYFLTGEMFARADVSTMAHFSFHGGMAMAMLVFSIREGTTEIDFDKREIVKTRFAAEIEEIASGSAWGAMDITEPDAGSDMAALRSVGEQDADGNWFVTGQKIFITSGHGKYHFVIARTEKPGAEDDPFAGLGGLSFFLVPAWEDLPDGSRRRLATLDRVEHKLGHHGSVTASITFDRTPAHLVGQRGEGFKYMLLLMNNARLGVGFESIGLCEAAYRMAKAYAAERPSMGKTIDKHEMIADALDQMDVEIRGLRALAVQSAVHEEMSQKLQLLLDNAPADADLGERDRKATERELAMHKRRARAMTPLLKYLAAETAVAHARMAMQIHGGNGYMTEYGAEKLLRDALVMPIYEGTSQIQSLMAMKDNLMAVMKDPQRFLRRLAAARWRSLSARDPLARGVARLEHASLSTIQLLIRRTAADKLRSLGEVPVSAWSERFFKDWNPKKDFAFAMLHAERLTRMLADAAIAELLLEQAERFPERAEILARFLERAEPRSRHLADVIASSGGRLLAQLTP